MARGGYFVETKGADELAAALKAAAGNTRDLRKVHKRVAKAGEKFARAKAPIGKRSPKDSKAHKQPGYLRDQIKGGASAQRSWIQIIDESGVVFVQEFGGTSYWTRGGRGLIRSANRAHRAVASQGRGYVGTTHVATRGHIVYKKARKSRGYFVWNAAWYLRDDIARIYSDGVRDLGARHGIMIEVSQRPSLDLKPVSYIRRHAA